MTANDIFIAVSTKRELYRSVHHKEPTAVCISENLLEVLYELVNQSTWFTIATIASNEPIFLMGLRVIPVRQPNFIMVGEYEEEDEL